MEQVTSKWFEVKVRYEKLSETGEKKKVTEQYVVDALSFTEAEERLTEEASEFAMGEFEITAEKIAPYREVFIGDGENYYKAKVNIMVVDEKSGKEKKTTTYHLVQADDINEARKNVEEVYNNSMLDYKIADLIETPTVDLYEHVAK